MSQGVDRGGEIASQPLTDDAYFSLLGRVATGDAKLVIANSFAVRPNIALTSRELAQGFNAELEESHPDSWVPNFATISGYCELSLVPGGVIRVLPGWTSRYNKHYEATATGRSLGLSVGGIIHPWSLDHPDLSTHHVFSTSNNRGPWEPTRVRYKILNYLLDHPAAVSEADIVDGLDTEFSEENVWKHVRALKQHGLIEHRSKMASYNPTFALSRPNPPSRPLQRAETRRIYEVLDRLYTNRVRRISFERLLGYCLEGDDPTIDPVALRESLVIAAARHSNIPALSTVKPSARGLTKISLKPAVRAPLQELFDELKEFKAQPERPDLQAIAEEIITDGACVAALFDKWARVSSKIRPNPAKERAQIRRAVGELGVASFADIYDAMQAVNSSLSPSTIKLRVLSLVDEGEFQSLVAPVDDSKKRQQPLFMLASP